MNYVLDPSYIDPAMDSRSATFENPTGGRGMGGTAHGGRKGAPSRILNPGERVVLADLEGPGTIRHIWMAFPPATPELLRALTLEVFYDGAALPSVSVPALDFFGLPHGRPAEHYSALFSTNEGHGFNAFVPMPFRRAVRVEFINASPQPTVLYYEIDFTLEPSLPDHAGYLHAAFRRENPTVQRRDFVIAEGLRGPGRFLGCVVGVRVIDDGMWYGEGEVKIYRDGDRAFPTICGTGLEDLCRQRLGAWPPSGAVRRRAPLCRSRQRWTRTKPEPELRGILPLASRRSRDVPARAARDDPADRSHHVSRRPGGAACRLRGQPSRRGRRMGAPGIGHPGVGHRRAHRRLLRDRLRILPRSSARPAPRRRRGDARHLSAWVREARPAGTAHPSIAGLPVMRTIPFVPRLGALKRAGQ